MADLTNNKQWQQYPDETAIAYSRFSVYLELGTERTLKKVGEKLGKKGGYEKQLQRWSAKYNWVKRSAAHDEEVILESLLNKKRIVNRTKGRLLQIADKAVDTIVDVMDMANHTSGLNIKSNAKERLKAAEMVLNRIGVIEETEETAEKSKPMGLYQQINQHFYGKGED